MFKQLIVFYVLFVVHNQLAECGKFLENDMEKMLKLGIKSLDEATDLMRKVVDTGITDENNYVLRNLRKSVRTGTKSKPKKSEGKKGHSSKVTTSTTTYVNTSTPPKYTSLTGKFQRNDTPTGKPPTSISPLPNIFLASTSLIPTQKPNRHLKRRNVSKILPPERENQPLRTRESAILLRIKAATVELESLLQMFMDIFDHGKDIPSSADMTLTQTTPTQQRTTAEPYPEAYQGFSPIMNSKNSSFSNSSSRNRKLDWKFIRRRRSLRNRRYSHQTAEDTRWRQRQKKYKTHHRLHYQTHRNHHHHPETKILVSKTKALPEIMKLGNGVRTKGLQMTVLKSSNCSTSGPVITEVLKTVWSMEKMIRRLGHMIDTDVRKLGNQGIDSTNEERADIKANSDRISQMQVGLSGKIDALRYTISTMMTSQKELGRSVSMSLETMMGILSQMVTMVTKRDNEMETRIDTEEKLKKIVSNVQNKMNNARENTPTWTKLEDIETNDSPLTKQSLNKSKSVNIANFDNLVINPPKNKTNADNNIKPNRQPVFTPSNALNVTSHVKTIWPRQPPKKVEVLTTDQKNDEKILKGEADVKPPQSKAKSEGTSKHAILVTKPPPRKKTENNTKRASIDTKSESTTEKGSLVTKPPEYKAKSENTTRLPSLLNGIRTATPVKISRNTVPPKSAEIKKTEQQNVGKSHKNHKGGKQHGSKNVWKENKIVKGGNKNVAFKTGKTHGKQNAGKLSKQLKGRIDHRKSKAQTPGKKTDGGKQHGNQKSQTPNKRPKGGKLHRKLKAGKQRQKLKFGKTHKKPRLGKSQRKPKGKKPSNTYKVGKQNVRSKIGKHRKALSGVKQHVNLPSGRSRKMLKERIPRGKPAVGKSLKMQKNKPGKAPFHNDHTIVNKFKNNEYSNRRKNPIKQKSHRLAGLASNRRHGNVYTNHNRKQRHRFIKKRDKQLQRLLLEEIKKFEK